VTGSPRFLVADAGLAARPATERGRPPTLATIRAPSEQTPGATVGPNGRGANGQRDGFLDAVRAIAVIRVVLWHTFGFAAITYFVAAVPAMFFVTGSLLAKSFDRRSARVVLLDRVRRMLVPLWVFGIAAWAAMVVAHEVAPGAATSVHPASVLWWVLPLGNPQGNRWEGGWMSSPLWYLRVLLWLFVLSPVLVRAVRRWPAAVLASSAGLVFLADWIGRHQGWTPSSAPDLVWQLGDLPLYGTFLMLGVCHRDGRFTVVRRSLWLAGAATFGALATWWCITQPVPLHVVNNSHPAHLLVGGAWLCVAMAFAGTLTRFVAHPRVAPAVHLITQRSLTIYLWHSTAIILSAELLDRVGVFRRGLWSTQLVLMTAFGTVLAVLAFGWVEDLAGRRRPRLWPSLTPREGRDAVAPANTRSSNTRSGNTGVVRLSPSALRWHAHLVPIACLAVATLGLLATATGPSVVADARDAPRSAAARLPIPSQQPPRPVFTNATAKAASPATPSDSEQAVVTRWTATNGYAGDLAPSADTTLASALGAALSEFTATTGMPGATVGVLRPGVFEWTGTAVGDDAAHPALAVSVPIPLMSITKSFTATQVLALVDEGTLSLDQPLPTLDAVPDFPYAGQITIRQLLTHRSGLVTYRDDPSFAAHPEWFSTATDTVQRVGLLPLAFAPGTRTVYSSTNYLVLGLLVEQIRGQSIDGVIDDRILQPYGFAHSSLTAASPGEPNGGTAGVVSDMADLLRWGVVLYRDQAVVSDAGWSAMNDIDLNTGLGGGEWIYCPCSIEADGRQTWRGVGHSGGTTMLVYSADDDLVIGINLGDTLYEPTDRYNAIVSFIDVLRRVVDAHTVVLSAPTNSAFVVDGRTSRTPAIG
jgi:CubicO group peptidase (beta-lactamase class C family)/peptidoglycan/LPS O-acetylase OafA/YrhL